MTAERFSTSFLWNLQQEAYTQFGISAWTEHGVPFYLTSNPHTARQYAQVILGYLRDLMTSISEIELIDTTQPLYIFDLGAGTGRFGYLLMRQLFEIVQFTPARDIKIIYVLTDIVEDNIAFWQQNPLLKPYFEAGLLDCAYYRHDQTVPLKLLISGQTLTPENVVNPIVLLANYFFDTIPQDFFRVEHGNLSEGRISLCKTTETGASEAVSDPAPEQINRLQFSYEFLPISQEDYYANPLWNGVLRSYRALNQTFSFLVPVGAFQIIDYFHALSKSRLLLIGGDQGVVEFDQMLEMPLPRISLHGTFSVAVNYHALALYLQQLGGVGLLTQFSDPKFVTIVGVLGGSKERFLETQLAFHENLDRFEPQDYWFLAADLQERSSHSLSSILRLAKVGDWDPINFISYFEQLRQALPSATEQQRQRLIQVIGLVQNNYFPIGAEDAAFYINLGVLAFDLKDYLKALELFKIALQLAGERADLCQNLSACYRAIGDFTTSRDYFLKAQRKQRE